MGYYYSEAGQQRAGMQYSQSYAAQQAYYSQAYAQPMLPSMSRASSASQGSDQSSPAGYSYTQYSPSSSQEEAPATSATERGWICPHPGCMQRNGDLTMFTRKADLERHIKRLHEPSPQLYDCFYPGCNRVGFKGLPRADKLRDHLREVHKVDPSKLMQR